LKASQGLIEDMGRTVAVAAFGRLATPDSTEERAMLSGICVAYLLHTTTANNTTGISSC